MGLHIVEFDGKYKVIGRGFSVVFKSKTAMESALPQLRKKHRANLALCSFDIEQCFEDDEIRKEIK